MVILPLNSQGLGPWGFFFPYEFMGCEAMEVHCSLEFIGFGAMEVNLAYKFIWFGARTKSLRKELVSARHRRCGLGAPEVHQAKQQLE